MRSSRIIVSAAVALVLAACGSSHTGATASASSGLKLAQCMRAHGVTNFPDPSSAAGGGGVALFASPGSSALIVNGVKLAGPVLNAAVSACKLFGSEGGPQVVSESRRVQILHFAQCMRAHGVDVPDPSFSGGRPVIGVKVGAGQNLGSPAFAHARLACAPGLR